jgi:hypothetical protein
MLEIYRRHNPTNCSSTDTQKCKAKKRPCPIWIRGSAPSGRYFGDFYGDVADDDSTGVSADCQADLSPKIDEINQKPVEQNSGI